MAVFGRQGARRTTGSRPCAAVAALLLVALPASAQWRQWDADFDEGSKPWKEIEAKIPSYPRDETLVPFQAGGLGGHRYYVDASSLSIGEDGVVRYTLVVRTAGGATNVTYEGIRCEMRQHKYYATGRPDGIWMRAREPQWRRIELREVSPHHAVLYQEHLCAGPGRREPVRSVKEAVRSLRYGAAPIQD